MKLAYRFLMTITKNILITYWPIQTYLAFRVKIRVFWPVMVRGQRRVFPKKHIKTLPSSLRVLTQRLTILLRLAMVFNRGRSVVGRYSPHIAMIRQKNFSFSLPEGWLAAHPLTEADLQQEMNLFRGRRYSDER